MVVVAPAVVAAASARWDLYVVRERAGYEHSEIAPDTAARMRP